MSQIESTLFKLRVHYQKVGRLRFLGHLEVAKTIERSIRRAGFPYAVTQGYSPHMRIAYSSALPVGYASTAEYFDVILTEYIPISEALVRLTMASPKDLAPCDMKYVDMHAPTLGAFICRQDYKADLFVRNNLNNQDLLSDAQQAMVQLIQSGMLTYLRGNKRKSLKVAEQLLSHSISLGKDPHTFTLSFTVSSGNEGSLRLEILLAAWDARFGLGNPDRELISSGMQELSNFSHVLVTRTHQWGIDESGKLISPIDQERLG